MANGLFEQLRGIDEDGVTEIPAVSSHNLAAAVREVRRGVINGNTAKNALGLTDQSVTELQLVIAKVVANNLSEQEVTDVFDLIQSRKIWTDKAATVARLGL